MINKVFPLIPAVFLFVGCAQDEGPVRTYIERSQSAPAPAASSDINPHAGLPGNMDMSQLPPAARKPGSALSWNKPESWVVQPASGMRLASFRIEGDADAVAEVSVIALGGGAGGLEANISRWLGQLGVEPSHDTLHAFVTDLPTFTLEDGAEGLLVDLGSWVDEAPATPSTLAGIVPAGGQTVFVKMTGPRSLLAQEAQRLETFCISLKAK